MRTKGDVALHKLRGEHKYSTVKSFVDPQGDEIEVRECSICGNREEINKTAKFREDLKQGRVTTFTSTINIGSYPTASYFSNMSTQVSSNTSPYIGGAGGGNGGTGGISGGGGAGGAILFGGLATAGYGT